VVQSAPFNLATDVKMETSTVRNQFSAVEKRIRRFYELLNKESFDQCFRHIDPLLRGESFSVTEYQYENSLRQFVACYGYIRVIAIALELHLGESSVLYANRDFAVGQTTWADTFGEEHLFQERWVRNGRRWYTRSTGLVTPTSSPPEGLREF
jgi:hypothetical protein